MGIAARILDSRLHDEIREKKGLTYSVFTYNAPDQVYKDMSRFLTVFTAHPDKAVNAALTARKAMEKFAKEGPTDEEMDTVRKQLKNQISESIKKNSYWASVLADLDYHKTKLSDVKSLLEDYTTYTKEDVHNALKKYIIEERRFQTVVIPVKPEGK